MVYVDASTAAPPSKPGPIGDRLQVDETLSIQGLAGPVDVVRDGFGMAHIYATSAQDAMRAEGFVMARDRGLQMELLRRMAEGRMAEVLAHADKSYIDNDIVMRTVGLHRQAREQYAAMAPASEARLVLDAFADGVSQFNAALQAGTEPLPAAWRNALTDWFTPWDGADCLAVLRLRAFAASYHIDEEGKLSVLLNAAHNTFNKVSPDATLARRAGILPDLIRFAPATSATIFDAFPPAGSSGSAQDWHGSAGASTAALAPLGKTLDALRAIREPVGGTVGAGSNAWAVSASRSLTGHAMLAADPHLSLTSPAALWLVHIDVAPTAGSNAEPMKVAGAALPGVPGVLVGFNARVAWAPAASWNDEADAYAESFSEDGETVRFNGNDVPLQHVQESIAIEGAAPLDYDVRLVPHHGPVLPVIAGHTVVKPDPSLGGITVRWTGQGAQGDIEGLIALMQAPSVAAARAAIDKWSVGTQAFVLADSDGEIASVSQAMPARDRRSFLWNAKQMTGQLPCLVLPGQGGVEWTGKLSASSLPSMTKPHRGWVAAANADPVGLTLDGDPSNDVLPDGTPLYLSCTYDIGFRQARIAERIEGIAALDAEDMLAIQSDARSALGARITRHLRAAIDRALAEAQTPGTYPGLTKVASSSRFAAAGMESVAAVLDDWKVLEFSTATGTNSYGVPAEPGEGARASRGTLLFNTWLVRLTQLALGDETLKLGLDRGLPGDLGFRALVHLLESDPTTLPSYDAEARDSILWDDLGTEELEGRDERMITAMLDAIDWLTAKMGDNRDDWRWGILHTVRLEPIVDGLEIGSIPPAGDKTFPRGYPRHGDLFGIDASSYNWAPASLQDLSFTYRNGPAMRMVVRLEAGGPRAFASIAGEASMDATTEEVEYWRNNGSHEIWFTLDEVVAGAKYRTVMRKP